MRSSRPCTSSVTACRRSRTAVSSRRTACSSSLRLARSASARPSATRASATEASTEASAGGQRPRRRGAAASSWARRTTARRAASAAAWRSASNCALHRPDARLLGPHPLLRGLEPQARLDLGLARRLERGERAVARGRVEHGSGVGSSRARARLRLVGGALGVGDALLGVRGGLPRRSASASAASACTRARLSCSVRCASCASNSRRAASACLDCSFDCSRICALLGELEAGCARSRRAPPRGGRAARSRSAKSSMRLCFAPGAAAQHVAADDGAVLRDDRRGRVEPRERRLRGTGRREVVGDEHLGEQAEHAVGRGDDLRMPG